MNRSACQDERRLMIWTLVIFLVLLVVLGRYRLGARSWGALEARERRIQGHPGGAPRADRDEAERAARGAPAPAGGRAPAERSRSSPRARPAARRCAGESTSRRASSRRTCWSGPGRTSSASGSRPSTRCAGRRWSWPWPRRRGCMRTKPGQPRTTAASWRTILGQLDGERAAGERADVRDTRSRASYAETLFDLAAQGTTSWRRTRRPSPSWSQRCWKRTRGCASSSRRRRMEPADKKAALTRRLRGRVPPLFLHFLLVVIDKRRQRLLSEIGRELRRAGGRAPGPGPRAGDVAREPDERTEEDVTAGVVAGPGQDGRAPRACRSADPGRHGRALRRSRIRTAPCGAACSRCGGSS